MNRPRLLEPPLGQDAQERPTLAEVHALWEQAQRQPIPAYAAPRRFRVIAGRAVGPVLCLMLATCQWQMQPPQAVKPSDCFCSPVSDRHGWTQTSGLEDTL